MGGISEHILCSIGKFCCQERKKGGKSRFQGSCIHVRVDHDHIYRQVLRYFFTNHTTYKTWTSMKGLAGLSLSRNKQSFKIVIGANSPLTPPPPPDSAAIGESRASYVPCVLHACTSRNWYWVVVAWIGSKSGLIIKYTACSLACNLIVNPYTQ
jgi:hypothetical protein